jgi:chaperonin GroES
MEVRTEMKIKPLGNRILLKTKKAETKTAGGIYIPESSTEEKKQGIVEAVGDGKEVKESGLKAGDIVIYDGYHTTEVKDGETKYIIVEYKDIVAKIE